MMPCEAFREVAIDLGSDAAARRNAMEALSHIENCPECQKRLAAFDRIHKALSVQSSEVVPPGGWAEFENRLSSISGRRIRWRSLPISIGAVAASLLLGAAGFEIGRQTAKPTIQQVVRVQDLPSTTEAATFAPSQLNHELKAFDQVSKVFDGKAGWMLVSDRASDIGVTPERMIDTQKVLMLRLTLTLGGQTASEADLLVIPGQTANLTVPLRDGDSLHYRVATSTGEPTRLGLWLDINTPHGGQPLAALATTLRVEPGQSLTAGQLSTSAGEYQLNIGFARASLPGSP